MCRYPFLLASLFCIFGCKKPQMTESDAQSKPAASMSPQNIAKILQAAHVRVSVSITDAKPRLLFRDDKIEVSYPAGTVLSANIGQSSPLDVRVYQTGKVERHGIDVKLLGDTLRYKIARLTYEPKTSRFQAETDPKGVGISGFVISKAMDWFVAPKVPEKLKAIALDPVVGDIAQIAKDAQTFLHSRLVPPGAPKIESTDSLANLSVNASITFPKDLCVSSATPSSGSCSI